MPPKASEKLPKGWQTPKGHPRVTRRRTQGERESYSITSKGVLKQVHPTPGVSSKGPFHHKLVRERIFGHRRGGFSLGSLKQGVPIPVAKSDSVDPTARVNGLSTPYLKGTRLSPNTPPPNPGLASEASSAPTAKTGRGGRLEILGKSKAPAGKGSFLRQLGALRETGVSGRGPCLAYPGIWTPGNTLLGLQRSGSMIQSWNAKGLKEGGYHTKFHRKCRSLFIKKHWFLSFPRVSNRSQASPPGGGLKGSPLVLAGCIQSFSSAEVKKVHESSKDKGATHPVC
ncbi:hypothetical protein GWK47_046181 [Chionoecetes opilio]|uniref:Uncharacterized protein n=1 Tax=Chionoecetes opilio TaxID=41210 RepID=A0A8J4YDA2_CHIOP|nr:hypothetical protein GWK47_046181 [Chionoecetes opilio]